MKDLLFGLILSFVGVCSCFVAIWKFFTLETHHRHLVYQNVTEEIQPVIKISIWAICIVAICVMSLTLKNFLGFYFIPLLAVFAYDFSWLPMAFVCMALSERKDLEWSSIAKFTAFLVFMIVVVMVIGDFLQENNNMDITLVGFIFAWINIVFGALYGLMLGLAKITRMPSTDMVVACWWVTNLVFEVLLLAPGTQINILMHWAVLYGFFKSFHLRVVIPSIDTKYDTQMLKDKPVDKHDVEEFKSMAYCFVALVLPYMRFPDGTKFTLFLLVVMVDVLFYLLAKQKIGMERYGHKYNTVTLSSLFSYLTLVLYISV